MNVIVIGAGKVGYYLTRALLEHGHHPVVIEMSKAECAFLANDLDVSVICGDGTMIGCLEEAGAAECDALIGVTGRDESNLIACQLAKRHFGVGKTIAKANNPKNAGAMQQLGVDIVINGTNNIVRLLEHEVDTANIRQLVAISHGEAAIWETVLPAGYRMHGKKLSEIRLPNTMVVISVNRGGRTIIPRGDTTLESGDTVLFMAQQDAMHDVKRLMKLEE